MNFIKNYGSGCRIDKNHILSGLSVLILENKYLCITVIVDKGADIFELQYKPLDIDLMWKSPIGLLNPGKGIPTKSSLSGNFNDYYEGGWQDIFPNGGPAGEFEGAEFGLHGEVSLLPWEYEVLENTAQKASVKLTVKTKRYPFIFEKILTIFYDKPLLRIDFKIKNDSPVKLPYLLGEHIAIGEPFLNESCHINLDAELIRVWENASANDSNLKPGSYHKWPVLETITGSYIDISKIPGRKEKTKKMLFIENLNTGSYSIINTDLGLSFNVNWDKEVMPYIWYWLENGGTRNYPWFGRTYNIALEPFNTPYPGINDTLSHGKAFYLEGNNEINFWLEVSIK